MCHRDEETTSVDPNIDDRFEVIPDEGLPDHVEPLGSWYEMKAGAHFYSRIDLTEDVSESEIGKVPRHCQHMFGSLSKTCAMPALFLQIESRVFQVWYDFFKLDIEGDRIPVHMRLVNRMSRLKTMKKTVEDVSRLFNALGRELFLAYDIQFYLKFKAHYMSQKGFCKGCEN